MATTQGLDALLAWRYLRRALNCAPVAGRSGWPLLVALLLCTAGRALAESPNRELGGSSQPQKPAVKGELPQTTLINTEIRRYWEANRVVPSDKATDDEWCRRVFLDVLGRIPSVDELKRFNEDSPRDRRAALVNRIFGDAYIEEYARNWTSLWTNTLIGRSGGTERRSLIDRQGLQQSLRRALERNTPYDKLVSDLVSARGVSKPGEPNFNGFVNFLAGNLQENGVQAAAKTSQIFLGMQIQCTQCHNHPFNDWKQNQFWEMNAFFRQTRALRRYENGRDVAAIELIDQDFAGETNKPDEAVVFYEQKNGLTKPAFPVFVDGTKLKSNSGYVSDVNRRQELAKMIVSSDYLALAIVNRLWSHFFGFGFTKPIDDMGPHNAPSHPELLNGLAAEFRTHSHNLQELMRWILLSEPYALSSKITPRNKKDDPALGEKPMFSHFYLRQMRAEELYESLLVATEAQHAEANYEKQEATKRDWLKQFTVAFGTDDNEETTTFNGTIPQALMMMNGDLINQATKTDKGGFLHRVAMDPKLSNAAKINYLYRAALARKPSIQEISLANELLVLRAGDPVAALQDVWWAVLNSNEFILNH